MSLGKTVKIRLNIISFLCTALSSLNSCLVSGKKQESCQEFLTKQGSHLLQGVGMHVHVDINLLCAVCLEASFSETAA